MEKNMNKLIGISIFAALAAAGAAAATLYVLKKRQDNALGEYEFDDDDLFDDCECGDCFIDGDDVIEKAEETFADQDVEENISE